MGENKIVKSEVQPLKDLFGTNFDVDFYQREYVWQRKQLEDLIIDLSNEFLKNWNPAHQIRNVNTYDPYFMGEIVVSDKGEEKCAVIDGQQRITTLTLFLIYILRTYGHVDYFPKGDVQKLIYSDWFGELLFKLDIEERKECMLSLYENGEYIVKEEDSISVKNIVSRYLEISECWNDKINEQNIVPFIYWIKEKVMFSKVWTNSDEFAYVIFETMNDRGLSLTQVEMLRSYLLANIDTDEREKAMHTFDEVVKNLIKIKLSSKSKAEFEFFKIYFRGHYAQDFSQAKNSTSDFVRIGKEFHRWVRDNEPLLELTDSTCYIKFINRIKYFADVYQKINNIILNRNSKDFLYLVVNSDYGFTLQPALILSAINYMDSDYIVEEKIKVVSKYLTKVLTWRVWNHWIISQSSLESPIYELCKKVRGMSIDELKTFLNQNPIKEVPELVNSPTLNQQNRQRIKVLLALITEIVAYNSGESNYILNNSDIEVEHIWSNHYDQHLDEFDNENDFANTRNNIGDLLVLPKSFNASFGDNPYESKVIQYFSHNILAQSLNEKKYENNPGFVKFITNSNLKFKPYSSFKRSSIIERADLYREILLWNWRKEQ